MSEGKPTISEEKQQGIVDLRRAGASQQKVADAIGVSRTTVKKYQPDDAGDATPGWELEDHDPTNIFSDGVDYNNVIQDEFIPESWGAAAEPADDGRFRADGNSGNDEWTGPKPSESPLGNDASSQYRLTDDYSEMTPGEFVKQFFEDFEVGVRTKFAEMVARRADRKQKLPDKDKMKAMLQQHSSGIGNANDAEFVSEEWWEEAKNYLAETDATAYGTGGGPNDASPDQGSYVGRGENQNGGRWMQIPGQGVVYGRMEQQPDGSMRFIQMQPPQQPGMMGGQMGPMMGGGMQQQQDDRVEKIEQKIGELSQKLDNGGEDAGGTDEAKGKFKDLVEIKEMIEAMQGGDGDENEGIRTLQRQLQQMQQQIASEAQQQPSGSPKEQALMSILQDDSISGDRAIEVIERMEGETDPEVEKARIESQTELKKLEQKKQRAEKLIDGLDDVFERIGQGIGQGLAGQKQARAQAQQQQPTPNQQPAHTDGGAAGGAETADEHTNGSGEITAEDLAGMDDMMSETWECPECGAETEQDPKIPGVECQACDYAKMQCPACASPVEIRPAAERSERACPSCANPVVVENETDGNVACLGCDWAGAVEELGPEVTKCDNCGQVHQLIEADPQV